MSIKMIPARARGAAVKPRPYKLSSAHLAFHAVITSVASPLSATPVGDSGQDDKPAIGR